MDIHDKHETDLTKEERRLLEKEKLGSMDWKHKLEYIWDYYKPQIFGVVGFFILIWGGVSWYQNAQKETIVYTVAIDGHIMEQDKEEIETDFKEYLGDEDKDHVITIDTSVTSAGGDSQAEYNANIKMSTIIAAGAVDIIIGPEGSMDQYIDQDIVYDLDEVLPADAAEKYQDKIIDGKRLEVTGNPLLEEKVNMTGENLQLIVLNMGPNKETAGKFIEYLLEQ